MGEGNRQAPPGGMLLNIDGQARPDERPEPAGAARSGWVSGRRPAAEPSWGRVLATTIKLWVLRQVTVRRWRTASVVAAVSVATVTALAVSGVFARAGGPAAPARAASRPAAAKVVPPRTVPQASPARAAAAWIAGQLSSDAIIACDPAMCAALQAQGVAASRLIPLRLAAPNPRGAAVVVTSAPAVTQLTEAYAPAVISSFGSGTARIDVRAAEPGGAAAYQMALRTDLAARMSAGSQLLRNGRIRFTAQDAAQLRAGEVDTRLLATLAALSSQYSFSVAAFGDASPGVAVLYRGATIAGASQSVAGALALVKAQVPPYLPVQAAMMQLASGQAVLSVEFAAPSPLGLLTAVLDRAGR